MRIVNTYSFLIIVAGIISVGCAQRETIIKQVLDKEYTLISLTPEKAIEETFEVIYQDIKALKSVFPQLAEIESANIGANSFRYEYGFIEDSKIKGPSFKKNGCHILVRVEYPINPDNLTQLVSYDYPDINFRFWLLVRVEPNGDDVKEFESTVDEIISNRMDVLIRYLKEVKK